MAVPLKTFKLLIKNINFCGHGTSSPSVWQRPWELGLPRVATLQSAGTFAAALSLKHCDAILLF